jgi:hypothetical protein
MDELQIEMDLEEKAVEISKEKKRKLYKLFRQGNEASWLKFLKTDEAQEILNEYIIYK